MPVLEAVAGRVPYRRIRWFYLVTVTVKTGRRMHPKALDALPARFPA